MGQPAIEVVYDMQTISVRMVDGGGIRVVEMIISGDAWRRGKFSVDDYIRSMEDILSRFHSEKMDC